MTPCERAVAQSFVDWFNASFRHMGSEYSGHVEEHVRVWASARADGRDYGTVMRLFETSRLEFNTEGRVVYRGGDR
ncbi:hypothetical protein H7J07_05625 [Mycobacterium koreense]|uniref:Uncharacterized protein n=1 Tax=Mycolicibacillus koreensis TaxID=1069220 RepID=A0A7I7SCT5_9MYCO|nr:hypothetical protein [Mycolicibacillus koreensis]MCV7247704.1 hypothetical protein [Mycolicibacillus koreensis]OSC34762.1 hypothetical protein B8W67_05810 [Mycolicibacillus koreensis]BBY54089.1 hypothetical protein MKOR_13400 [Mycolicibacillus koreensis]